MALTFRLLIFQLFFVALISSCASIPSDFEEPGVTVTSFKPVSTGEMTPQFEIKLHITNPNRDPLEIDGIAYSILLDGNEVMSGVSNDLPTVEPYGEADVTLNARANLFGGFQLITGLMKTKKENIDYEFKAKLDVGTFMPRIDVVKKGTL